MSQDGTAFGARMSLAAGVQLLVFIAVAAAGWEGLAMVLHMKAGFTGFLFLWYWATVEKAAFDRLLASVLGAGLGAALAWMLLYLPTAFGGAGLIVALAVLSGVVLMMIMGQAPLIVNNASMLFLTVLTAPPLLGVVQAGAVDAAILLGALYFGGLVYLAKLYTQSRARARAVA